MNKESVQNRIRIMRRKEVQERTGVARSTLYELMEKGVFPRPIKLGLKTVGWLEHEVEDWLLERVRLTREVKP